MGESQALQPVVGLQPPDHHLVDLLETRIGELVARHREARRTIVELRTGLREREARIAELQQRVQSLEHDRARARERVDQLIGQVERMEEMARAAAEDSVQPGSARGRAR